jgi:hypothetical protein
MPKKAIKPIMPLKHDFVASMDAFVQASLNLYFVADQIKAYAPVPVQDILQQRLDEWKTAWSSDEDEGELG